MIRSSSTIANDNNLEKCRVYSKIKRTSNRARSIKIVRQICNFAFRNMEKFEKLLRNYKKKRWGFDTKLIESGTRHLLFIYCIIRHSFERLLEKKGSKIICAVDFVSLLRVNRVLSNTRQLLTSCRVALVREFTTRVDSARWSRVVSNCIASRTYFPASRTVMDARRGSSHSCTVSCQFFSESALTGGCVPKKKLNTRSRPLFRETL